MIKRCTKCGKRRKLTSFYKQGNGRRSRCKWCAANYMYAYHRTPAYRSASRARHESESYLAWYNSPASVKARADATRRYKRTRQGRIKLRKVQRLYRRVHKIEACAHEKVKYAIRTGALKRPKCCSKCRKRGPVHGHHEDYAKPLQVIWLCPRCHAGKRRRSAR